MIQLIKIGLSSRVTFGSPLHAISIRFMQPMNFVGTSELTGDDVRELEGSCYHYDVIINSLRPSDAYMRQLTNQHWFRQWLGAWSAPSHYLKKCWNIVNWTLRNKLQGDFNRNSDIFFQENAIECVFWEMAAILSRPQCVQCVNKTLTYWSRRKGLNFADAFQTQIKLSGNFRQRLMKMVLGTACKAQTWRVENHKTKMPVYKIKFKWSLYSTRSIVRKTMWNQDK